VSAERRFSAISNETRVRVDASMKRLMTSCPRSAGTFFTGRSLTSLKPSAVSRMRLISSGERGSMPRRSWVRSEEVLARIDWLPSYQVAELPGNLATRQPGNSLLHDQNFILIVGFRHLDLDHFVRVGGDGLADDIGVDRQLAMAAVPEHGEPDRLRTSEVDQRVERGAHRAAGGKHVGDEHPDMIRDGLRELGRLDHRLRRDGGEVVAIERDVDDAEGHRMPFHLFDLFGDALADGDAAAADADDHQVLRAAVFFEDLDGHAPDRAGHAGAVEQPFLDVHRVTGLLASEVAGG